MLSADTEPRCAYDSPFGFSLILSTFIAQAIGLTFASYESPYALAASWIVDALGLAPGIYLQMVTKPYGGWFGSVPSNSCSMRESGYAMALWIVGELLTFGAGLRVAVAVDFGRNVFNTIIVIVAAFTLQLLVGLAAEWLD